MIKANKKIILSVFALVCGLAVIAVSSFVNFIIDPSKWQTTEFLTKEIISCAIVIFSMLLMYVVGKAGNAQNEKSNIAKATVKFLESRKRIVDINAFVQWVTKVFQPQENEAVRKRELRRVGLDNWKLLDLDVNEIKSLLDTPQKIGDVYFKSLNKEQIKKLLDIKKGKYNIDFVDPHYYLTARNSEGYKTISEKVRNEGKKKTSFFTFNVGFKLLTTVLVAMVFASLTRDLTQGVDVGQAWLDFSSRLFTMATSSVMGYILGTNLNDIDAEYIETRVLVHDKFVQDKTFKPLTEEEMAKEEFKDRVLKETVISLPLKEQQ